MSHDRCEPSLQDRWDWRGFGAARPPCGLSIVTTMYRSAGYIDEFYRRMTEAAGQLTQDFELIFVNDGSPDPSLEKAKTYAHDPRVVIVDLSRNYGHHQAFMAGLSHARGRKIFFMDVDLEEQPEWILEFDRDLQEKDADVVYGIQEKRVGSLGRVVSGSLFYKLFNAISDIAIPVNPCTVRMMTRGYASALLELRDRNLFLAGNYAWLGFRQVPRPVNKIPRRSASNYNLVKMFLLFVNAVTSFSTYPLKAVFFLGLAISCTSLLFGCYIALDKLLHPEATLLGWSSLMASLWFVAGVIMFAQGLIGIYVAKIFDEVKHKPPYVVRRVYFHKTQQEER